MRFGHRLAQLRQGQGLSQAELADLAGISRRMVLSYEAENVIPPGRVLPALARALQTTIDDLFESTLVEGQATRTVTQNRPLKPSLTKAAVRKRPAPASFGEHLGRLRRQQGLSQAELGSQVGISQRMVAYYESQKGNPPVSLLPRFADALNVSLDELFGRNGAATPRTPIDFRLWRRFRGIEDLTPRHRSAVLDHIKALLRSQRDERKDA